MSAIDALADRIREISRRASSERVVLGIAGSPGSGKTTLAQSLVARLNERTPGIAVHLPMDGFHLSNASLDRLGLHHRKGAIDTFDGWGFVSLLDRIRAERGHTIFAPGFERTVDEGIAGEIAVESTVAIVVVEGNYLLATTDPWAGVKDRLDAAWFCATPAEERLRRLVDRHTRGGRSVAAAEAWATEVDGANAVLIEATKVRADLVVSGLTGEVLP